MVVPQNTVRRNWRGCSINLKRPSRRKQLKKENSNNRFINKKLILKLSRMSLIFLTFRLKKRIKNIDLMN